VPSAKARYSAPLSRFSKNTAAFFGNVLKFRTLLHREGPPHGVSKDTRTAFPRPLLGWQIRF